MPKTVILFVGLWIKGILCQMFHLKKHNHQYYSLFHQYWQPIEKPGTAWTAGVDKPHVVVQNAIKMNNNLT